LHDLGKDTILPLSGGGIEVTIHLRLQDRLGVELMVMSSLKSFLVTNSSLSMS
jgi:hypothetical protein